jgi:hypothetical protein
MPATYFRQVPDSLRRQHLSAVASIRELKQSGLSLKIETKISDDITEITMIHSDPKPGLLLSQLNTIPVPPNTHLSRVKVFSSADNELALNIYTFENLKLSASAVTPEDSEKLFTYMKEVDKEGKTLSEICPSHLLTAESLKQYFSMCTPTYVRYFTFLDL